MAGLKLTGGKLILAVIKALSGLVIHLRIIQ